MLPSPGNGARSISTAGKEPEKATGPPLDNLALLQMSAPAAGSVRGKVPLKPGRSLLDWMRLGKSGKDLAGTNGKLLKVTTEELARHCKEGDAWMVLNGRVYNVTPYMEYHPGGVPELMKGAGIDGTLLFNEVHRWVNYESMLEKCLVGKYIPSMVKTEKSNSVDNLKTKSSTDGISSPSYSWSQTETTVTVLLSAESAAVEEEQVIIDHSNRSFLLRLLIDDHVFHVELELADDISKYSVSANALTGKIEVVLTKEVPGKMWLSLERDGNKNVLQKKRIDEDVEFRKCSVTSVTSVTHDTKLLCLELPLGMHMIIPVGCHVFVSDTISGELVTRSFTAVPPSLTLEKSDERFACGRYLHLMIKIYPDGLLTPSIGNLKPGDKLDVSTTYSGNFRLSVLKDVRCLILYAAGTGFTPMASLLHHCLMKPNRTVRDILLVFFNKQTRDILWKEQLDQLSSSVSGFSVRYVLSEPPSDWTGLTGRIRKELLEELSPKPTNEEKVLLCVCGPTQFTQKVLKFAGELGYSDDQTFAFTG